MFSMQLTNRLIIALGSLCIMMNYSVRAQQPSIKTEQDVGNRGQAQNRIREQKPLEEDENPELIGKRDINKHQLNFYSLEKEIAIGRQLAMQTDQESKFVTDPVITEYVNRIGQSIVLHSDAKVPFTIKVIDSDEINAFALPGGFFYVNKGLILEADSEAEVAGVMAHEIAHVAARHGVEQASKGTLVNYASIPLIFLGGLGGYAARQVAGLAIPIGFLRFSRGAEEEADALGVQYLWSAGYDPHAMVTFFEKLEAKEKKKPGRISKIFSTHPATGDRIDKVTSLLERFPDRGEYLINSSEFDQVKNRLVTATNAQRTTIAQKEAQRPTLKRRPSTPQTDAPDPLTGAPDSNSGTGQREESKRPTLKRQTGSDLL